MAGLFDSDLDFGGILGLLGSDAEKRPAQSWRANLTGLPDTDGRGQSQSLGMALLNAGAAIADADNGRQGVGGLLAAGAGGLARGLGFQAMQRQNAEIARVKRRMAEAQARREVDERARQLKADGLGGEASNPAMQALLKQGATELPQGYTLRRK